jgi:hypothetical protein
MVEHEQEQEVRQPDRANGGIEAAFAAAEADAEAALKAASGVVKALKRAQGAARQGQVRDWQIAVESARQGISALDRQVAGLGASWQFDEERYLQNGEFSRELIDRATEAGVRISELDNRLYSYPVLIRVMPGDRALMIDRKRERRLRPSVLIRHLRDLQRRPPRFRPADFLNALYATYRVAVERKDGRSLGTVVPLAEIYELLTLLPGQSREYAKQEFARDIYLLDQSGETTTKDGAHLEFHVGAGARVPRGALTVVTQHGAEKTYLGISFAGGGA